MKKYRKRPIVIEAEQWAPGVQIEAVLPVNKGDPFYSHIMREGHDPKDFGWIKTLEGPHLVQESDWVIRGVAGEYYPCKNEIFKLTYEEVTGLYGPDGLLV